MIKRAPTGSEPFKAGHNNFKGLITLVSSDMML